MSQTLAKTGAYIGLTVDDQTKRLKINDHWLWMDGNCKKLSHQEYYDLKWTRKMSQTNFQKSLKTNGRNNENYSYACGMHALNMCLLMLGYDKNYQWYKHNYPHGTIAGLINVGLHGHQFNIQFITKNFKNTAYYCGDLMPWNIVETDYSKACVIILTKAYKGVVSTLHYIIVIGMNDDGSEFVVTDSTEILYLIGRERLEELMYVNTPTVRRFNAYRVD